jgi:hypothetical protein
MSTEQYRLFIPTKRCTKCKESFPATIEYFSPDRTAKDRLKYACRLCLNAAAKAYHAKNLEACRARSRLYHQTHRAQVLAQTRAWRRESTAHLSAYNARYRTEHLDTITQRSKDRYQAHRDQQRTRARAYAKTHPEERLLIQARRRARKAQAPRNDLTVHQWRQMKAHYGHRCVYCGKKSTRLTQDHITPLSKDGSHTLNNVVPACPDCNFKKHAGPVLTPIQPLLL